MRIHDDVRYAGRPLDVAAMLADPGFSDQVASRMGSTAASVDIDGDAGGAFTVTTVRTLPTDGFPDIARRFVGSSVDVRQVDQWAAPDADGTRSGSITVEIVGAPLRLTGTMTLTPDGDGTRQSIDGDLRAGVPLIGGKLERAAEPAIHAAIRQQIAVGTAWFG